MPWEPSTFDNIKYGIRNFFNRVRKKNQDYEDTVEETHYLPRPTSSDRYAGVWAPYSQKHPREWTQDQRHDFIADMIPRYMDKPVEERNRLLEEIHDRHFEYPGSVRLNRVKTIANPSFRGRIPDEEYAEKFGHVNNTPSLLNRIKQGILNIRERYHNWRESKKDTGYRTFLNNITRLDDKIEGPSFQPEEIDVSGGNPEAAIQDEEVIPEPEAGIGGMDLSFKDHIPEVPNRLTSTLPSGFDFRRHLRQDQEPRQEKHVTIEEHPLNPNYDGMIHDTFLGPEVHERKGLPVRQPNLDRIRRRGIWDETWKRMNPVPEDYHTDGSVSPKFGDKYPHGLPEIPASFDSNGVRVPPFNQKTAIYGARMPHPNRPRTPDDVRRAYLEDAEARTANGIPIDEGRIDRLTDNWARANPPQVAARTYERSKKFYEDTQHFRDEEIARRSRQLRAGEQNLGARAYYRQQQQQPQPEPEPQPESEPSISAYAGINPDDE
jgi:hypothetical protein